MSIYLHLIADGMEDQHDTNPTISYYTNGDLLLITNNIHPVEDSQDTIQSQSS